MLKQVKGLYSFYTHFALVYLQFEHSWTFAQHHLDKVTVVDSVTAASRHLNDHFFQLQVGLGHPELLHHQLQTHHIWENVQLTIRSMLRWENITLMMLFFLMYLFFLNLSLVSATKTHLLISTKHTVQLRRIRMSVVFKVFRYKTKNWTRDHQSA